MPVDDDLIGAFSNDTTTVQSFFKVGIQVWWVIPIKDLPEPSHLCLPMVFTGSSRHPKKYARIHEFVTHSMRWVDLFALSTPIVKHRPDMPLIEANTNKSQYSPYQKKQHIQGGASNRLQDLQYQLLPPIIEPWSLALLAVDARPLFARLTILELLPPNLYHQEWRTVLGMGFLHGDPASGTAAEKRQIEVHKMMDRFMEELLLHTDNAATSVFWHGKNYEGLSQEECQEILWELAELIQAPTCKISLLCTVFLMKAMQTWEDAPLSLLSEVRTTGWTEKEFLLVEKTVADYYCDIFWQYFGHAPVLPWQLRHQTSEDYVPEAQPQMITSHSGVYVDVEELS
ncbi:hypothetical protein EDD18DRAFT_1104596 [Armillaria luteobubalina]|uniref:Uncharacterized protein n=1 Tax=Armillaria luteobubalina TaxID=153913 RepID=A0AA39TPX2_9AGAR|nr:hypothetical protein EDD18DRAFT_1104596 [Armillaria luteobubalina]